MILDVNSLGIVWSLVLIGVILALVVAIVATRAGGRPRGGLMWDQMNRAPRGAGGMPASPPRRRGPEPPAATGSARRARPPGDGSATGG